MEGATTRRRSSVKIQFDNLDFQDLARQDLRAGYRYIQSGMILLKKYPVFLDLESSWKEHMAVIVWNLFSASR